VRLETDKGIRILDVGCGPGNWALAAAKYNARALVIGIDVDELSLSLAVKYQKRFRCSNVEFRKLDYGKIAETFGRSCFEYVLIGGALQYLDEETLFRNVSRVLGARGRLLVFWSHSAGYYMKKLVDGIFRLQPRQAFSALLSILSTFMNHRFQGHDDHAVLYYKTRRIAAKCGIQLRVIKLGKLDRRFYEDRFCGVPFVLNMMGTK